MTYSGQYIKKTEAGRDLISSCTLGLILLEYFLLGHSCHVKNLGQITE